MITVTYYLQKGSASKVVVSVPANSDMTIAGQLFTRNGYTQIGWSRSPSTTPPLQYTFNETYHTDTSNLTFYAVWVAN